MLKTFVAVALLVPTLAFAAEPSQDVIQPMQSAIQSAGTTFAQLSVAAAYTQKIIEQNQAAQAELLWYRSYFRGLAPATPPE